MEAIKCMIVGDSKVGKTDLFLTMTKGSPAEVYSPTVFDTCAKDVTVNDVCYNLALWDSSGDSLYAEIRTISYAHTDCFLICYAVNDRKSFENIERKWKPEILRFGDGPSVPLILVGLKSDLQLEADLDLISSNEVEVLKNKIGARHSFQFSTKVSGCDELIEELIQTMVECAVGKKAEDEQPPNPIWGFEDLKILLIGDSTVGKTSLVNAYATRKPMEATHDPTTEIVPHYQDIVVDGIEFFLGIVDLPSAPEFLQDRIKEYERANGVILVYAVNDPFSFQNLECQWVPELKEHCPELPFIIAGNKKELNKDSETLLIPPVDGEDLMHSIKAKAFLECSAKTMENVMDLFITAARCFRRTKDNNPNSSETENTTSSSSD